MNDGGEDLQGLVRRRVADQKRHRGLSLNDLANRAVEAGYPLTRHQLSQYASRSRRIGQVPYALTLHALAVALDVPLEEVADAALRSTGVPMRVRQYPRTSDRATVRGLCTNCSPRKEGFDDLVVVLPHTGLTHEEIAQLVAAIRDISAQQMEQRTRTGEGTDSAEA